MGGHITHARTWLAITHTHTHARTHTRTHTHTHTYTHTRHKHIPRALACMHAQTTCVCLPPSGCLAWMTRWRTRRILMRVSRRVRQRRRRWACAGAAVVRRRRRRTPGQAARKAAAAMPRRRQSGRRAQASQLSASWCGGVAEVQRLPGCARVTICPVLQLACAAAHRCFQGPAGGAASSTRACSMMPLLCESSTASGGPQECRPACLLACTRLPESLSRHGYALPSACLEPEGKSGANGGAGFSFPSQVRFVHQHVFGVRMCMCVCVCVCVRVYVCMHACQSML